MATRSAEIRANLNHPLIDGDSHIIEFSPVLMDYIRDAGGEDAVTDFRANQRGGRTGPGWYQMNWDERKDNRAIRAPWWALPTKNTFDRCTAMLPKLYHSAWTTSDSTLRFSIQPADWVFTASLTMSIGDSPATRTTNTRPPPTANTATA